MDQQADSNAPAPKQPRRKIGLSSALTLSEQIQALAYARKSGVMTLYRWQEVGRVVLKEGQLVDAVLGPIRGPAAARSILHMERAESEFSPQLGEVEQTIHVPFNQLLMESAVNRDEANNMATNPQAALAAMTVPRMRLIWGDGEHAVAYVLEKPVITVGRGLENDLQILDVSVSRLHAELHMDGVDAITVRDLGSTNGTSVDGATITTTRVRNGQTISFGDVATTLKVEGVRETPPDPTRPMNAATPAPALFQEPTRVMSQSMAPGLSIWSLPTGPT